MRVVEDSDHILSRKKEKLNVPKGRTPTPLGSGQENDGTRPQAEVNRAPGTPRNKPPTERGEKLNPRDPDTERERNIGVRRTHNPW